MPFDSLTFQTEECAEARELREAMDLIADRDRWCKGDLTRKDYYGDDMFCMVGALFKVCGTTPTQPERGWISYVNALPPRILLALNRAATRHSGRREHFWNFNDRPTTSHSDVMAVMQEAYEELKGTPTL